MKFAKNMGMSLARMSIVVVFIITAVYNVVVFTIPFNRVGGFWTGYGFSMFALALMAAVCFYAFDREGLRSKVYGVSLLSVVWCYLIVQLIFGLLEMILYFVPFQFGIALNAILLGACLIGLITVNAGKEEVERIDEKIKEKVFYIKTLQTDVESLAGRAQDDLKKPLKDLVETIRYSDPMNSPQLAAIENKIEVKTAVLAEAVDSSDGDAVKALCNEMQQLFAERNRKCKILK